MMMMRRRVGRVSFLGTSERMYVCMYQCKISFIISQFDIHRNEKMKNPVLSYLLSISVSHNLFSKRKKKRKKKSTSAQPNSRDLDK